MKIPQEFTFSSKNNGDPKIVITGCDLMDIIANSTYLIHYLHGRLKGINPQLAEDFKITLRSVIDADDSPVWEDVQDTDGATEICMAIPK